MSNDGCKIRPVRVTRGDVDVDVARAFRVDVLKLVPSCDFETSSRAVKKGRAPP